MHTTHAGLSFAAQLKPGSIDTVNSLLEDLNKDPGNNNKLPFAKSLTTLVVSGIIIPAQDYYGTELPATLMIMTSFTGPFKDHLDDLVNVGAKGLRELFSYCVDFPQAANSSDDALKRYIKKKRKPDTFYTGMQYITHTDIGKEEQLRLAIEAYIDTPLNKIKFVKSQASEVKKDIEQFISSKPEFAWTRQKWEKTFADFWALWGAGIQFALIAFILIPGVLTCLHSFNMCTGLLNPLLDYVLWLVILLLTMVIIAGVLYVLYRFNEMKKQFVAPRQPDKDVNRILSTQNHPVMNEMTISGPLKQGWIHTLTFNTVLRLVSFIRGAISIPTISTARWLTIDGGKRLVFISNFENLSESYVRDFIDSSGSATKINLLFGQGNGYPATKWILGEGCITHPDAFLNDVHLYQQATKLWYWSYMHLSIDNINNNRKIRLGLYTATDEAGALAWLKLL